MKTKHPKGGKNYIIEEKRVIQPNLRGEVKLSFLQKLK